MMRINARKIKPTYSNAICNLVPDFCFLSILLGYDCQEVRSGLLVHSAPLWRSHLLEDLIVLHLMVGHFCNYTFPFLPQFQNE